MQESLSVFVKPTSRVKALLDKEDVKHLCLHILDFRVVSRKILLAIAARDAILESDTPDRLVNEPLPPEIACLPSHVIKFVMRNSYVRIQDSQTAGSGTAEQGVVDVMQQYYGFGSEKVDGSFPGRVVPYSRDPALDGADKPPSPPAPSWSSEPIWRAVEALVPGDLLPDGTSTPPTRKPIWVSNGLNRHGKEPGILLLSRGDRYNQYLCACCVQPTIFAGDKNVLLAVSKHQMEKGCVFLPGAELDVTCVTTSTHMSPQMKSFNGAKKQHGASARDNTVVGLAGSSARPASDGVWNSYATDTLKRNLLRCQPDGGVWMLLDARTGVQLPQEYCAKSHTANYKERAGVVSAHSDETLEPQPDLVGDPQEILYGPQNRPFMSLAALMECSPGVHMNFISQGIAFAILGFLLHYYTEGERPVIIQGSFAEM